MLQTADFLGNVNTSVSKLSKSRGRMVNLLNTIAEGNLANGNETFYQGENIALKGRDVPDESDDLYIIAEQNLGGNLSIAIAERTEHKETRKNPAQIKIPRTALYGNNLMQKKLFSYAFKDNLFFVQNKEERNSTKQEVRSFILSATFVNESVKNLKEPIEMIFQVINQSLNNEESQCSFWNVG